ncbi:MAG: acyl-CoA ligase (AMP-forming), exosortase A system-associated [Methylovulum sp.]|uniref:acyl-CoA ligase (AMP-forming), exosortase A system-associated n=1 Tax=Methylovulum sp. TaxID=1916980 RepID=UPI00262F37D7|nr:acyl-CoA ligase (AMP-forming), exosortase A system-associated [Methylovulum sp.]MDD2725086.1 acyl-CoA ligase (AMP-forming), exosortase A system-associated [Methylovulum sp.]MDD5124134.1 acyl-CoA ligase (AMP-forming), exosortase A system-associated [Methylovulum sp.]
MPTLFHHLLTETQAISPDAEAIVHKKLTWTYKQLGQLVQQQARALQALNLQPQQRVAVYLPKQIETVSSFLAISLAGGVFVPVNPVLKAAQLGYILSNCNVTILVTSKNRLPGLTEVLAECPDLQAIAITDAEDIDYEAVAGKSVISWQRFMANAAETLQTPPTIDTDMAAILYTSGSTGKPKGVVISHRNLITGAISVSEYLSITAADRLLAVLPFSFDYGLNQLTTALLKGATCVLLDYLLPRDVVMAMETYQITGLAAVPPLWAQLANVTWPEGINGHLRYMTNSGGKMPKAILAAIRAKVPDSRFFLMYGLTEAFRSTYLPPEQIDIRPDSMGKAIPNAEILVVREDGSLCDAHEAGELVHRGSLVAMGYWNDPATTAVRFKPAPGQLPQLPLTEIAVWSGDTVTRDEAGYLYFVGRKDDMIKTSGYRVSPTEIEEVVYASGLAKEAAALGIEHDVLGQAVVVVVSADEPEAFDGQTIVNVCKAQLPNFMVPAKVIALAGLPKNPNGKIDRKSLTGQFANIFNENS